MNQGRQPRSTAIQRRSMDLFSTYRSMVEAYECRGRLMLSLALFLSSKGSAGKSDKITSLLLHNRPSFDPAHGIGPVRPGGKILVK